jgi:nucleotide-binding universal stress UspA family protein/GNAT superfamily N-acetyltransferase
VRVTLRDGSHVTIRPVEPDDRRAIEEGFERLSPESRYRRFFGPMPQLSSRHLDYLTNVDHHDHEALVAVDDATGDGVGVARFVRTEPDVAEPAMAVVDDWQGRGIGSVLLEQLVTRAQAEGIRRFDAPVLATNRDAIRVLERLGETTLHPNGREVELRIELPDEPETVVTGSDWRGMLGQFAAGSVEPARSLIEMLWPRGRRGEAGDARRNTIVVGTDGSEHAGAAVAAAADLAKATGAAVDVVGVHRFLPLDRADLETAVHAAAGTLRERGLHVHEHVKRGDPALVLADFADEQKARLIVVGAGDHSKLSRRLVGSVADSVAERAPCNVLIVRARERP